jgi:hypothetical protein
MRVATVLIGLLILCCVMGLIRERATRMARTLPAALPEVETNMVSFDTSPHRQLASLVVPAEPEDAEFAVQYLGDSVDQDARFVLEQICLRASTDEMEIVPGNIITNRIHKIGDGSYLYLAALVHTQKQSIRFACVVEWSGNKLDAPVVRSVQFDDLDSTYDGLTTTGVSATSK